MNPKYKEGDVVSIKYNRKKYTGKVFVIDITNKGYGYDIMCSKPKKVLII